MKLHGIIPPIVTPMPVVIHLPGLDETTVFVVSDHGFLPSHREIRPNVKLRRLGAEREARFVMNHGAGDQD